MPHLDLTLFGAFQAQLDNQPLTAFHSVKVQGLLAYLAVEGARPHARESLTALFWPEDAPQSAQQSLRQALYALRRILGDADNQTGEPFLLVTRQAVQVNPAASVALDVAAFLQQVQQGKPEQAAALYTAELLTGLTTDSAPFEEWLRATRQYLHNLALNALNQLTQQQLDHGDYLQAVTYARRQLTLEPWREEAHRQVMTALALSGERSVALAQYESCLRVLAEELGVDPAEETIGLYEQIRSGQLRGQTARANPFPASPGVRAEPPAIRHNLPPQPTPFIGRKTDLEQIATRLDDLTCRLLTIVGPGGMGKTRLAIAAAQSILERELPVDNRKSKIANPKFEDGIFFVALAGVASPDLLVSTIASALDFTFYGSGDPKSQLLDYLKPRSLLLVLDNCEHLLAGIELVADLLVAAPKLKVLATSREPLNLREEWLHVLGGMSFPRTGGNGAMVEQYSAVQLFVQCARRMKPAFDLAAEGNAVVKICQLVDGMPLGIELAATWLKFYGCPQIIQEMQRSLDFLATTLRNLPARHRSMRAVFEHSWNLLSVSEQQVLQRLSIFRGGFDRAAAQWVAGATLSLLVALAEKSLIQVAPSERYQIHELLRQFAEEKLLTQPEEVSAVQKRHSAYYLNFLQEQEIPLKGRTQGTALTIIEGEIENIRIAWRWALTHENIETLADAADALYVFYYVHAWFKEGKRTFEQAAVALAMSKPAGQRGILWAKLLTYQALMEGWFDWAIGGAATYHQVEQQCRQIVDILQLLGAAEECSCALRALGEYYRCMGQFDKMREYNQQALDCAQAKGDRWEIGQTLYMSGFGYYWAGEYETAIACLQRGVNLGETGGDAATLSDTLNVLSRAYRALGDYKNAQQAAQSAFAIRTTVGDRYGMAWSQQVLGDLFWRIGDYEMAQRYSQASVDLFAELGLIRLQAVALNNLGNIACSRNQIAQAKSYFQQAIAHYAKSHLAWTDFCVAETMVGLAMVCLQEGQFLSGVKLLTHVLQNREAWHETKEQAKRLLATLPAELVEQAEITVDVQDLMGLVMVVMTEARFC